MILVKKLNTRQEKFLKRDPLEIKPWEEDAFNRICAPIVRSFCEFFLRRGLFKISYPENLTQEEFGNRIRRDVPVIFYSNHVAWPDTFFVPYTIDVLGFRQFGVLKIELFRHAIMGIFFWVLRGRPLVRETSAGFLNIIKIIKNLKPIIIFAQGGRSKKYKEILPIQEGVAVLAMSMPDIELVPIKISYTKSALFKKVDFLYRYSFFNQFPFLQVGVEYGNPKSNSEFKKGKDGRKEILSYMSKEIDIPLPAKKEEE